MSYETEIVNNGVFFTDSNGLELLERNSMAKDEEFDSDTISMASVLFPITTTAIIRDSVNRAELGIIVGTPTFATSLKEG